MMTTDGHDILYAGAGVIWGLATVARGIRVWREENRTFVRTTGHSRPTAAPRMNISISMLCASMMAVGCAGYLFIHFL